MARGQDKALGRRYVYARAGSKVPISMMCRDVVVKRRGMPGVFRYALWEGLQSRNNHTDTRQAATVMLLAAAGPQRQVRGTRDQAAVTPLAHV
jgi:hypothetical protein